MKVSNIKIYDLEESIIASGYPMQPNIDEKNIKTSRESLQYWSAKNIQRILKTDNRFYLEKDILYLRVVDTVVAKISLEDIFEISSYDWEWDGKYVYTHDLGNHTYLHDLILNGRERANIHFNGDKLDNRRENLRYYEPTETPIPSALEALKHYRRILNLGKTPSGSGHDQALTGIRIAFDLTFSNKAWVELERYRFMEFVSSQSTMHRISKFDIDKQVNKYVTKATIDEVNRLKEIYLETGNMEDYLALLYNTPSGFELTARITTNYRALKTVYSQRKDHRLPEWREFCKWIESLPYSELIIGE